METHAIGDINRKISTIMSILEKMQRGESENKNSLNSYEAIDFIKRQGVPMSKSRLYKLVSLKNSHIPFKKVGNRLHFLRNELEKWCSDQISKPVSCSNDSNLNVISNSLSKIKF